VENNGNYVLTGPRRAGKTYALYQIAHKKMAEGASPEEILYINFEDERLIEAGTGDLAQIAEAYQQLFDHKPLFFLDEIQIVPGWEKFARRLADQKYTVYVTGSNAGMLSKEIATTLGGRFFTKDIYPFSFEEYLFARGVKLKKNWEHGSLRHQVRKLFDDYFYCGGFPELLLFEKKKPWLENLFQKIFYGDVIVRNKIRNEYTLKLLIKKLAESVLADISFNRMKNIIQSTGVKVNASTVIEYIAFLEDAFLIYEAENFLAKISERETNKKYYFVDNGILALFLEHPENRLLENMVAMDLARRGLPLYFLKDKYEVDFYLPDTKTGIQVLLSSSGADTLDREIASLFKCKAKTEIDKMVFVTLDEEQIIEREGEKIEAIPIWKWLLRP
jgi:predicted AAA+ superfamily ATPase